MQATQLYAILLVSFLYSATASAQVFDSGPSDPALFDSVANLPGDDLPERIGGSLGVSTQLNIASGGSVGVTLFVFGGGEVNISGGSVGNVLASGGEVNISGGSVGNNFNARNGSMINISGGSVGDFFRAQGGSEININGGSVGIGFEASEGSTTNISGGSIGYAFRAFDGSIVNLFGSDFVLNGVLLDDLVAGETFTIVDRNVTLSGLLADGSAFSFDLNFGNAASTDNFHPDAVLSVTLADAAFLCGREVPDQEFIPPSNSGITLTTGGDDPFAAGQTFTVGRTGNLSRVDLLVSYIEGFDPVPTDGVNVEILTNLDLTPTPTRLGLVHVPHSMIPTSEERRAGKRMSVDLTSLEIAITEGDVLAITVSSPSKESYAWWYNSGYGGGQSFSIRGDQSVPRFGDLDYGFRTFVNPSSCPPIDLLGDCNLDGVVNFLDISPFISILTSGEFLTEADVFEDGVISFLDIQPFIMILSSQ